MTPQENMLKKYIQFPKTNMLENINFPLEIASGSFHICIASWPLHDEVLRNFSMTLKSKRLSSTARMWYWREVKSESGFIAASSDRRRSKWTEFGQQVSMLAERRLTVSAFVSPTTFRCSAFSSQQWGGGGGVAINVSELLRPTFFDVSRPISLPHQWCPLKSYDDLFCYSKISPTSSNSIHTSNISDTLKV